MFERYFVEAFGTVAQTDFLLLPLVSGVTWVKSQKAGVFPEDVA